MYKSLCDMDSPEHLWGDLKWEAVRATCFKQGASILDIEVPDVHDPALVCVVYSYREVFPEAYGVGVLEYDGGDIDINANAYDLSEVETQAECWAPSDDIHEQRLCIPYRALRPANDAEISAYLLRLEER